MKFLNDVLISAVVGVVVGIGVICNAKSMTVTTSKNESNSDEVKDDVSGFNFDASTSSKISHSKIIDWILFIIVLIVACAAMNHYSNGDFLLVFEALFRTEVSALKNMWEKLK